MSVLYKKDLSKEIGLKHPSEVMKFDEKEIISKEEKQIIREKLEERKKKKKFKIVKGIEKDDENEDDKVVKIVPYWYKYNKEGELTGVNTGLFRGFLAEHMESIACDNVFYFYQDGYYQKKEMHEVMSEVQKLLNDKVVTFNKNLDIYKQWAIDYRVMKQPEQINNNPYLINLKNGIYNLKTGVLEEHRKEQFMTIRINANYNATIRNNKKNGENFLNYLETSIPDKKVQKYVQKMMGYCLTSFTQTQKFFVLNGGTDTGKSVIINLTQMLINKENVSNKKWQELKNFGLYELHNKILNAAGDLPRTPITEDDTIKELTGEDWISAQRKFLGDIRFKNRAKFLFSTNGMPKNYGDKSEAFFNRLVIIPFNEKIKKKDPHLTKKLEKELDFIFMWALEGLQELIKDDFDFGKCDKIDEEVEKYKRESSTVIQFIEDICEFNPKKQISKIMLFQEYQKYCSDTLGVKSMGRTGFYRELEEKFEIEIGREGNINTFKGITFSK